MRDDGQPVIPRSAATFALSSREAKRLSHCHPEERSDEGSAFRCGEPLMWLDSRSSLVLSASIACAIRRLPTYWRRLPNTEMVDADRKRCPSGLYI